MIQWGSFVIQCRGEKKLESEDDIMQEALEFYKSLLGTPTSTDIGIDSVVVQSGPRPSQQQCATLTSPVTSVRT